MKNAFNSMLYVICFYVCLSVFFVPFYTSLLLFMGHVIIINNNNNNNHICIAPVVPVIIFTV